ncbi:MAG: hypothetical protein HRF49_09670 [bacterium]|jgi:hypothetical protein
MEQKKGGEAGKTILAVFLLLVMIGVFYWKVWMPMQGGKSADKGKGGKPKTVETNGVANADSAGGASAANSGAEPAAGKTTARQSQISYNPFKPVVLPPFAEIDPAEYFSAKSKRIGDLADATINTRTFSESTLAKETDKGFAGGAYFTSVEVPPVPLQFKNPFTPLLKEQESSPASSASPGESSTPGGGIFTSPWSGITLPGGDSSPGWPPTWGTPPSFGGKGEENVPDVPKGPPDENTLWIMDGPVVLKGIAISEKGGASALLEIGPEGNRKVVRVRANQVMEGRYKVNSISEDGVDVLDTRTGKVFALDLIINRTPAITSEGEGERGISA